jgi:hypothetical protein
VTTSWEAKSYNTDGLLNGDVIYPMVNYGQQYQGTGTTPTFEYSFGQTFSFDQSGRSMPPQIMKPALRLKSVLDKIFAVTDYSYVSDFFDTDYFKSIYMDTFQNGKLGIESASAVTNQNIFRVFTNTNNQRQPIFQQNGTTQFLPINWRSETPDGYDPLGNFTLGTNLQIAPINEGYFQVPYAGDYFFNMRFNYSNPNFVLGSSDFYIIGNKNQNLNNINVGTSFYTSDKLTCDGLGAEIYADLYFSATCQVGDYIKLFILLDGGGSSFGTQVQLTGFNYAGVTTQNPMWDLYTSPELSGEDLVDFSLGIDNMNSMDFIKSLITMFNLVVIQDENNKTVRFEPYNWYYNDSERPLQDWTQRVDLNSDYKIEPLSFDLAKEVTWTCLFTEDEFLNKEFTEKNDFVYGRYKYVSSSNIFAGEQIYEIPFGATPTSGVTGAANFIIPQYYYRINGNLTPYATRPHLYFWNGNRYAYKDVNKTQPGYWYLTSGATAVQQSTYPCVSHLTSLDIQIPDLVSDLNFRPTFDFFGNSNNQVVQFTQYNLYNLWWNDYIENIYSPETRRLTCRVFFNPIDVYETSLRDKIFIKDSFYTIERLNEINLVNRDLTEVNLIKDRVPYYKVIPPAPVYAISGNTPYPGVQPSFFTLCYVSLDNTTVCNQTAPLQLIYTFGSGTIENFDVVYYDTGTQLKKLEQGYYLRQQTGTDTFVVIDNYGRILEQPC